MLRFRPVARQLEAFPSRGFDVRRVSGYTCKCAPPHRLSIERRTLPLASPRTEDPLLHSARREMAIAAGVWFCAMLYSVTYCSMNGYDRTAESLTYVLGFPDWIFWGVILPWGLCTLFSVWFGLCYMQDHELEEGLHIDELRETEDA